MTFFKYIQLSLSS